MRTKEIEVYVETGWALGPVTMITKEKAEQMGFVDESGTVKFNGTFAMPAKILVELPDRKIEITESQFEQAFYGGHDCYESNWSKEIQRAKAKLFGEEK